MGLSAFLSPGDAQPALVGVEGELKGTPTRWGILGGARLKPVGGPGGVSPSEKNLLFDPAISGFLSASSPDPSPSLW